MLFKIVKLIVLVVVLAIANGFGIANVRPGLRPSLSTSSHMGMRDLTSRCMSGQIKAGAAKRTRLSCVNTSGSPDEEPLIPETVASNSDVSNNVNGDGDIDGDGDGEDKNKYSIQQKQQQKIDELSSFSLSSNSNSNSNCNSNISPLSRDIYSTAPIDSEGRREIRMSELVRFGVPTLGIWLLQVCLRIRMMFKGVFL